MCPLFCCLPTKQKEQLQKSSNSKNSPTSHNKATRTDLFVPLSTVFRRAVVTVAHYYAMRTIIHDDEIAVLAYTMCHSFIEQLSTYNQMPAMLDLYDVGRESGATCVKSR